MIDATVCVPWRAAPNRLDAFARCQRYWKHNGYTVITADSDPALPFLCAQARNNAVAQADTSTVIVADADTIPADIAQIETAVDLIERGETDVVWPFTRYYHLPDSAVALDNLAASPVQQVYTDSPGGIIVTRRETLEFLRGFDERFYSGLSANGSCFGYDDTAFRYAAETLVETKLIMPGQ